MNEYKTRTVTIICRAITEFIQKNKVVKTNANSINV